MIWTRFLIAEICVALAGFGVTMLLRPARALCRVEIAGLSLILGQCLISLLLFVGAWILRGDALVATVGMLSVALGAFGVARRRRITIARSSAGLFVSLLVPMLAAVAWQAGQRPLSADGLFNFEFRAQIAAANGGLIPASFFSDPSRIWAHPGYPLFLPLNEAWIYLCLGAPHQDFALWLSAHFTAAAMCLLSTGVARLTGDRWRGILAVVLLFLLPAATLAPGGASSLWADFPLAIVFLGAVIYLVEFARDGSSLALLAAFLALLPWVKREGMVLAAVAALALVWVARKKGKLGQMPLALLPLALTWLGWKIFLRTVHVSAEHDFLPVSMDTFAQHCGRLPFIAAFLGRELIAIGRWNFLWPLALAAVIGVLRTHALACWRILPPMIVALIAIYSGIYVFSAWDSLPLHLATSLARLLLPVAMPAVILIAAAIPSWRDGTVCATTCSDPEPNPSAAE